MLTFEVIKLGLESRVILDVAIQVALHVVILIHETRNLAPESFIVTRLILLVCCDLLLQVLVIHDQISQFLLSASQLLLEFSCQLLIFEFLFFHSKD